MAAIYHKKHHKLIAKVVKDIRSSGELCGFCNQVVLRALSDMFQKDNPKFNRSKFYTAAEEDNESES